MSDRISHIMIGPRTTVLGVALSRIEVVELQSESPH